MENVMGWRTSTVERVTMTEEIETLPVHLYRVVFGVNLSRTFVLYVDQRWSLRMSENSGLRGRTKVIVEMCLRLSAIPHDLVIVGQCLVVVCLRHTHIRHFT